MRISGKKMEACHSFLLFSPFFILPIYKSTLTPFSPMRARNWMRGILGGMNRIFLFSFPPPLSSSASLCFFSLSFDWRTGERKKWFTRCISFSFPPFPLPFFPHGSPWILFLPLQVSAEREIENRPHQIPPLFFLSILALHLTFPLFPLPKWRFS